MSVCRFLILYCVFLLFAGANVQARERVETIATRGGVTLSFLVTVPKGPPKGAAILFVGGSGKLKLWREKSERAEKNFLLRSRQLFVNRGVYTVTVDVATDQRSDGLYGIRDGEDHQLDIATVVRWIRQQTTVPLWLIGTSRGAISVAHLAHRLPIDGAVFTASVTEASQRRPANVFDTELERIRVPSLIVHHKRDDCRVTPAEAIPAFAARLSGAANVETLLFDGGEDPISRSCGPLSAHGFLGIEEVVIDATVKWMMANQKH